MPNTHLARLFNHDPLPWLLSSGDSAVALLVRRDLLAEKGDARALWGLHEPQRLVGRQQEDGSWRYPTKKAAAAELRPLPDFRNPGRTGLQVRV